jgi:hypothetical protein
MEKTVNAVGWFEIPAIDFDRAKRFYSRILDFTMEEMTMAGQRMGMFPADQEKGVGGAIVKAEGYVPSAQGSLVYLDGGKDLSVILGRVKAAGGSIQAPKTDIGEGMGFFAMFLDSEGNKVGLYSMG